MNGRPSLPSTRHVAVVQAALLCAALCVAPQDSRAERTAPLTVPTGGTTVLDDPIPVRSVRDLLSEQQDDAVEARALYMQGRMLLERRQFPDALPRFERAWRFDPVLVSVIRDIVPLAISLNREGEATRYAIIAAEREDGVPPVLSRRVAAILTRRLEFDRARKIYQRLREPRPENDSFTRALAEFEIGRLSILAGDFPQAANAFDRVRPMLDGQGPIKLSASDRKKLIPNPSDAYTLMAEAYLRSGNFTAATAMFERADQAKPRAGLLAYQRARLAHARGEDAEALKLLEQYFTAKLSAAGIAPYILLTELLTPGPSAGSTTRTGPYEDPKPSAKPSPALLERLATMVANDPDNSMLGNYYADRLRAGGKLADAERQFRKLVKYEPSEDSYRGLAQVLVKQRHLVPLLQTLGEITLATGALDLIDPLPQQIAEDTKLVDQLAAQAQTESPDDAAAADAAQRACVLLQIQAKNYAGAAKLFQQVIQRRMPKRGPFAVNVALQLMAADQPEPAIAALRQIINEKLLDDKEAELYHALAGAYALAKQYDKALEAARTAAAKDPSSARMAIRAGWVYYYSKQLKKAEQQFLQVINRFDQDHDSDENRLVMRDARQMLSSICVELDRPHDAEAWLLQVLDEFPEDVGADNDLGYLWCDQGVHLHRGLKMIQHAVAAEPENIAYRDSLGWAYYRLGQYDLAVQELKKAAADATADGVILDHLGDAYAKTQQRDQAIATWKSAAKRLRESGNPTQADQIADKIREFK